MRDGRAIYVGAERIDDVTRHPAFRNAARTIADLYEFKADPQWRELFSFDAAIGIRSRESSRDHRSSAHSGRSDTLANALRASTSLLIASSKGSPSGGGEPRRRRRLTYSSFTS